MSVRLIANVLDHVHGLPHGTKLLLLCLADYADDKGNCWPSFQSLANRSDMSRRHVMRVMSELEELGLIKRVEERPYKPTVYRLAIPTSDTHVTRSSGAHVTSDVGVTSDADDTRVVTPTSLGSDTHVTTTSDAHVTQSVNRTVKEPSVEPSVGASAPKPMPAKGPIQELVKAWYERIGEEPVNWGKAMGHGKSLVAARVTVGELLEEYDWLAGNPWNKPRWSFDLGTAVALLEQFRQSKRMPAVSNGRVNSGRMSAFDETQAAITEVFERINGTRSEAQHETHENVFDTTWKAS